MNDMSSNEGNGGHMSVESNDRFRSDFIDFGFERKK